MSGTETTQDGPCTTTAEREREIYEGKGMTSSCYEGRLENIKCSVLSREKGEGGQYNRLSVRRVGGGGAVFVCNWGEGRWKVRCVRRGGRSGH